MKFKKEELEKIKKSLIKLRIQVLNIINETKEEVKESEESKEYSQHQADEGTDDSIRTVTIQASNNEQSILRMIDRALEKIDEGTYGICDLTEKEISKARLDAIPYAIMTIDAQEKFEKQQN